MMDLLAKDLLRGRNIFVSGGGSGVNLAIAQSCAMLGANIAICGRTEAKLASAAETLQANDVRALYAVADVRDSAAVDEAFSRAADQLGPMDAVVCGAAGNFLAPAEQISTNGFRAVIEIDL